MMTTLERAEAQQLLDELCWWIISNCGGDLKRIMWTLNIRERIEQVLDRHSASDG